MLLQDAEFSVLDTCAPFALLLPTLPQLCRVTVWEPTWISKVPCKTGINWEWRENGLELVLLSLECYTSPFTSLEQIIVCMCVASVPNLCL